MVGGEEDGEDSGGICVTVWLVRKAVAGVDDRDVEREEICKEKRGLSSVWQIEGMKRWKNGGDRGR